MDIRRFKELYIEIGTITGAAKKYCEEFDIEYGEHMRTRFSRLLRKEGITNSTVKESSDLSTNSMKVCTAFTPDNRLMDIAEYCETYSLDIDNISKYRLITHTGVPYYNIEFKTSSPEEPELSIDDVAKVIERFSNKFTPSYELISKDSPTFDRLVYTDVHIGLDPNGGRNVKSLYKNDWDKGQLMKRLLEVEDVVISNRSSNVLYIDDLGDYTDGLYGKTSRGGHELPQNMDDKKMFEVGVEFKMTLVESLLQHYDKIVCHSITESNHAPLLDHLINYTVKGLLEAKHGNVVEYNLCDKFLNHYKVGRHTFIVTHGKDSVSLKFGMKPYLDANIIEKIDQYCKENLLYEGNFIEVSKGDSHRGLLDFTGSNDFEYFNFPAFSPPSNWVQTNFKNSKSGFMFFNIDYSTNSKKIIPYWF